MLEFRLDSINIKPAMTYSRAGRTTIGPRCLSAVFGMGTGVSTWAWSPAVSDPTLGARDILHSDESGRMQCDRIHHCCIKTRRKRRVE